MDAVLKKIAESIEANILPIIVFVLAFIASALISTSAHYQLRRPFTQ